MKYNFNENEINDMINMYLKEMKPISYISEKYKVDNSVIIKRLKDKGIEIAKGSPFGIKYWINRGLNIEDANKKIKEMKPNLIEYWLSRGYSFEDAKLKTELHLMNTERAFILKYGNKEGTRLFKIKKEKEGNFNSPRTISYWTNRGFSEEESKIKVSEIQNKFSLKKCIEKYGHDKGIEIFTERQKKWQKSLSNNGNMKNGFSKISQELFYSILETYDISCRDKIKFATHNGEFTIKNPKGGIFVYDFADLKSKKIIEYNGDMFHANPKKYNYDDIPNPFKKNKKASEIWEYDKIKINVANENNFDVLTIWDSEYRWGNKKKILDKCINFLNKNEKNNNN